MDGRKEEGRRGRKYIYKVCNGDWPYAIVKSS